jgi:hypothetical protein
MCNSDIWHAVSEPVTDIMCRIETLTYERLRTTGNLRLAAYNK